MGLFNREPKAARESLTAEVQALLYANAKDMGALREWTEKNFGAIRAYLEPGEQIRMITFGRHYAGWGDLGIITTLGCFSACKGRIDQKRLLWSDIESVTSGSIPNGSKIVSVKTASYRLDFREDDSARIHQMMSFRGSVERDVEAIVAAIRSVMPASK